MEHEESWKIIKKHEITLWLFRHHTKDKEIVQDNIKWSVMQIQRSSINDRSKHGGSYNETNQNPINTQQKY